MNNLGERLYELRTKHEMSQGDLAEKLNVSRQTISKWENNMSIPELDKIISLSNVFGVSVDYIVKGEGEESVPTVIDLIEADSEPTADPVPVKMITLDPTRRIVGGLSIAMGLINIIPLIVGIVERISILATSPHLSDRIEGWPEFILSTVSGLLLSIALFSRKEKFMSVVLIFKAVMSMVPLTRMFSGQFTLSTASLLLGMVASILVAVGYITAKKNNAKIYLVSIVSLRVVAFILVFINSYINYTENFNSSVFGAVLSTISITKWTWITLFVNIGLAVLVYLKANPKPTYEVPESEYHNNNDMYVGMVKHVLLSLFTFGIYNCIWTYKTTENLNCDGNQIQSGAKKLLLCIFVPFYRLYWYYNQSKRLENLMRAKDMHTSDFAIVTLILAIFVPIVAASVFLQLKLNEYAQNDVD